MAIRRMDSAAECGDCGQVFMRADLASFNVKLWIPGDPENGAARMFRMRLCRDCSLDMIEDLEAMEWENKMFDPDEKVRRCDWSEGWFGVERDLNARADLDTDEE